MLQHIPAFSLKTLGELEHVYAYLLTHLYILGRFCFYDNMPFHVYFRAREALRQCLPDPLKDNTFAATLQDDNSTKRWLVQLQQNLESPGVPDPRSMPLLQQ